MTGVPGGLAIHLDTKGGTRLVQTANLVLLSQRICHFSIVRCLVCAVAMVALTCCSGSIFLLLNANSRSRARRSPVGIPTSSKTAAVDTGCRRPSDLRAGTGRASLDMVLSCSANLLCTRSRTPKTLASSASTRYVTLFSANLISWSGEVNLCKVHREFCRVVDECHHTVVTLSPHVRHYP